MGSKQYKKGTIQGLIFSLITVLCVLSYFIYLIDLYLNNQIDPKFRWQSFVTSSRTEVSLSQDLIGFTFLYNTTLSIDQFQLQQNKTYLVYYPYFFYEDTKNDISIQINLDIVKCINPYQQGLNCLDFSQLSNYTLVVDNMNNILSNIYINVYGCLDLDSIKTTIPDNCAQQNEIDEVINGVESSLFLQLKTEQFNTTSKRIQTNFRTLQSYTLSNQFTLSNVNTQKQETIVKDGLLIQNQQIYQSPIQYNMQNWGFDRQQSLKSGLGPYAQISLGMDQIVQHFQIQYTSITEILALVNSFTSIIMLCRVIGRFYSQKQIQEDFLMLIMRNLFQDKCSKILEYNSLIKQVNPSLIQNSNLQEDITGDINEWKNHNSIFVPNFQNQYLKKKQNQEQENSFQKKIDFIDDMMEQMNKSKLHITQTSQEAQNNVCNHEKLDKKQFSINKNNSKQIGSLIFQPNESKIQIFKKNDDSIQKKKFIPKKNIIQTQKEQYNISNNTQQYTFSEEIKQRLKAINSIQMKKKLQNFFLKKCFKSKDHLKSRVINKVQMEIIQQETNKNFNIYEFYKDIIFLKKAISMLLTSDQLAAIQFVSLTDYFFNLDLKSKNQNINFKVQKIMLNYFEKQYSILQSEQIQEMYIQKFISRCQQGQNLTEVDQRIISSIAIKL
ncbi:AMP-binding enzyme family protein (macronuclear) [Tetrahymena thermophila SB210]|uniref:AMP-binding enzyme family protein n=1 Tax=Tetrahymena thermophila (strain SB210) TaxID=312017 RepID=I7LY17_TETTS|nr:AMP-binding enzyme family protein [Tetrahymena thermophila SB210]EAS07186.2 AMP-binding enzyme family protein [Tetrahymena thermophila SB210]|eukprot:XP_001027428.2 AMP-binding enzyme family protein [Tetrahymena thermophila SB210]